jgi:hypothetical protein
MAGPASGLESRHHGHAAHGILAGSGARGMEGLTRRAEMAEGLQAGSCPVLLTVTRPSCILGSSCIGSAPT